ncbi:hypothetical protein [Jatrophihabitans sp. GAS493]|uniref:hypothetical protein n=1 Tax=Jatrophihabitans sp. GAS493 TaxID=1907575 RepID=UPI001F53D2C7|nr:hypothetical protein [Jatrophihabitans sp. GAS493]
MTDVPGLVPNTTLVMPMNPVPVTVTDVPPATVAVAGDTAVTAGKSPYVNLSAATTADTPAEVMT